MMPSASEIAGWKRDFNAIVMPDSGNILSKTLTSDGQGGFTDTWGTVTASVQCRVDAFSSKGSSNPQGNEVLAGGAVGSFGRWIVTLPAGTEITTENRFEVNGRTFNVITVDDGKSWAASTRCILEQV